MILITLPPLQPPQERRILEETVTPLTPRSSALPSPSRGENSSTFEPQDAIVRSLADWERKQELLERQSVNNLLTGYSDLFRRGLWWNLNYVRTVFLSLAVELFLCSFSLAKQRGSTESVEWKRRENDRTSDISTADDSMKTGRRLVNSVAVGQQVKCALWSDQSTQSSSV